MYGIDLFAGAGGMSLGASLAGLEVLAAIEIDKHAADTYRLNNPQTKVINLDLRKLSRNDILTLRPRDAPLVVFGGPPCQGFSYSNPRHRKRSNATNWLCYEFLRYVDVLQPEWIVFENVPGFRDTANGFFLRQLKTVLKRGRYHVVDGKLNAVHFAVPQNRRRYFLIASRKYRNPRLPNGTTKPFVTVAEAISDLPSLSNGHRDDPMPYGLSVPSSYARKLRADGSSCHNHLVTRNSTLIVERYKHIPPGGNWEAIPDELMLNYTDRHRCHTGIYHRLQWDEPAIVIGNYRKNMLVHPTEHRGLSVREAARLQSFPDSYRFVGSIGFQQQQVANALPPNLARAVFEQIFQMV